MSNSPRNGGFWLFYGMLFATCAVLGGFLIYGFVFVRPADVRVITETRTLADSTKKAFDTTVVGRTPEGFHRKDMREWCEAFMRANPDIVCPDPYGLPGFRNPR